ncbi:MurR/RpiR family transcriptional regulator [Isoptericola sp. b490]|uniref:MurR/RpiR family transcriptional regulator n=1 Tax=Actinotalea lenta TaxID=3064654 RepID=UPI002712721B|nr:MurR/RpiR family transcriptional regulator [Isoptericola sp. b490]MDO8120627.1 MurR/RpiR family transcriptional regulator [Isoptericola sp. b490]
MRIATLAPSLQPSERRVADAIAADLSDAVESTAQQLADQVGVGRASVIRTAQTLGYDGYPQLRVALAREIAFAPGRPVEGDGTAVGMLRAAVETFAASLPRVTAALTESGVQDFVRTLDEADRVLIAANGLSAPLGLDAAMRLGAAGRPAEYVPDTLAQQIAARQLGPSAVCLALSGSGANQPTLTVASAARDSGARVLALTSFANAPLVGLADTALVIPPVTDSFRDELLHTSRATLTLVLEQLVELLLDRRGERARNAHTAVLAVLSQSLRE